MGFGLLFGVGFGVGLSVGLGVAAGQSPLTDGSTGWAWGSNRNPSLSPSWKVRLEIPRLDGNHDPPARATNNAQKLLVLVQQPGGNVAGSPSTWQTASLRPPNETVW